MGIHIYLFEFYAHLGNCFSFLVLSDIAYRLSEDYSSLYVHQFAVYKDMEVAATRLQNLVDMPHQYSNGYELEGYIKDIIEV